VGRQLNARIRGFSQERGRLMHLRATVKCAGGKITSLSHFIVTRQGKKQVVASVAGTGSEKVLAGKGCCTHSHSPEKKARQKQIIVRSRDTSGTKHRDLPKKLESEAVVIKTFADTQKKSAASAKRQM